MGECCRLRPIQSPGPTTMSCRRNNRYSVSSLFVLLRLGITALAFAAVEAVSILGCTPSIAEIDETQPPPLPQFAPDVPTKESPTLVDSMTSPDGSVVLTLPRSLAAGKPKFVFREMPLSPKVPPPPPPPPPPPTFPGQSGLFTSRSIPPTALHGNPEARNRPRWKCG